MPCNYCRNPPAHKLKTKNKMRFYHSTRLNQNTWAITNCYWESMYKWFLSGQKRGEKKKNVEFDPVKVQPSSLKFLSGQFNPVQFIIWSYIPQTVYFISALYFFWMQKETNSMIYSAHVIISRLKENLSDFWLVEKMGSLHVWRCQHKWIQMNRNWSRTFFVTHGSGK